MVVTTGIGDIRRHPWLKASIDAFADTVSDVGPVLDVGCGPGTVTAYLSERGLDVSGVDLSPRMIDNARRLHPYLRFSVASATEFNLDESSLGGVLGWWSLFNLPRGVLPQVLTSIARALKGAVRETVDPTLALLVAGRGDPAFEGDRERIERWLPPHCPSCLTAAGGV